MLPTSVAGVLPLGQGDGFGQAFSGWVNGPANRAFRFTGNHSATIIA